MSSKSNCGCFAWVGGAQKSLRKRWDNAINSIRDLFRNPTDTSDEVAAQIETIRNSSSNESLSSSVISAMAEAAVTASLTSIIEEAKTEAASSTCQLPEVSV